VHFGRIKVSWGDQARMFRHHQPWAALRDLSERRPAGAAGRLEWLIWHGGLFGLSVEACDADHPAPHLAVEVGAAYAVDTPATSLADLRERATRCARVAFEDFGADLARAYDSNHFKVRPSLGAADYLEAARHLPDLVTLVRNVPSSDLNR
jgi:hypothetical protein